MSRRAAVVNCSAPRYNLGAEKLARWLTQQGFAVAPAWHDTALLLYHDQPDLVALSVLFSWDAPRARDLALRFRNRAEVWCGGPGMTYLAGWWHRETGLRAHVGLDARFDRQRGPFGATFASRGCPRACRWCVVPRLEDRRFRLDWEFEPAPRLLDNNLSALPEEFQDHIVRRYEGSGVRLHDANSGFEAATFDGGTYERWRRVLRGPWRLAYDEVGEEAAVRAMLQLLAREPARRKRVYCLVGNEPFDACYRRVRQVLAWGGEPFVQPEVPLDHLGGPLPVQHGWTEAALRDFARYHNRHVWRSVPLVDYRPRRGEPPPFGQAPWRQQLQA